MFGLRKTDRIKRQHPIDQVIQSYGIELKKRGQSLIGLCPFHDDKTPSLSVSPDKGLFHCFGCSAGGDVITFVEKIENISNKEAIQRLDVDTFIPNQKITPPKPTPKKATDPDADYKPKSSPPEFTREDLLKGVARVYQDTFKKSKAAQAYLKSRGFENPHYYDHFEVGYCDGSTIKTMLPKSGNMIERLKEIGILNDKGNPSFYKCVIFPIKDLNGTIRSFYGRAIEDKRQCYTKGSRNAVWNSEIVKGHATLILTESILDAYSLIEIGFPNVLPLYGTSGFTQDHLNLLSNHPVKEVILCLDNDQAGQQAVTKLLSKLNPLGIEVSNLILPEGIKDPNEYIQNGGDKEDFQELIDSRSSLTIKEKKQTESKPSDEGLTTHHGEIATFRYGQVHYEVKGFKARFSDSLRVVINAEHNESKIKHTDRIDLYTSRSRKSFSALTANKFKLQAAKVEDDLLKIVAEIEDIKLKEAERLQGKDGQMSYKMTEHEEKEAIEFLKRPDLLERITKDLELVGYVGEDSAKLLCYFSAVSRITRDPISITVRALSSSGKSYLLESVSQLICPEAIKYFSRLSQQSLFYMEKDELQNKIVIIDEKEGVDSDYSMRTLLSAGKLVLGVVHKNPATGEQSTKTIEVQGNVAVWDSTTANNVNPENLSRVWEVWLQSSSHELTERIHANQRKQYSLEGWKENKEREQSIRIHRNAQRLLKPLKVNIPYYQKLSFPTSWTTTRRHNKRFLALLSVIALTFQHQKEIKTFDGEPYIDADEKEYRIAYNLVKDILKTTLSPLSKEAQDLLTSASKLVKAQSDLEGVEMSAYIFTRRQLREFAGWTAYKINKCLNELFQMEYIEKVGGQNGHSFRYRILSSYQENHDPLAGLTHPDELQPTF